jgi:hypothetical protein
VCPRSRHRGELALDLAIDRTLEADEQLLVEHGRDSLQRGQLRNLRALLQPRDRAVGGLADPEFRATFERERREIETVDALVAALDGLREAHGISKAELAQQIGKNPASVRRTLTAPGNP